jgi:hypothetical protein
MPRWPKAPTGQRHENEDPEGRVAEGETSRPTFGLHADSEVDPFDVGAVDRLDLPGPLRVVG